jgi:hypothetical protein
VEVVKIFQDIILFQAHIDNFSLQALNHIDLMMSYYYAVDVEKRPIRVNLFKYFLKKFS